MLQKLQHFYCDLNFPFLHYYTPKCRVFEQHFTEPPHSLEQTRTCISFKRFYAAFDKPHPHGPSGGNSSFERFLSMSLHS